MILLSAQTQRRQAGLLTCARLDGVKDDAKKNDNVNSTPRNFVSRFFRNTKQSDNGVTQSRRDESSSLSSQSTSISEEDSCELVPAKHSECKQADTRTKSNFRLRRKSRVTPQHVSFGFIHVREHALTVGDHDWCDGPLPITLDWRHAGTRSIGVDDFEWMRERQGRTPRGRLNKLDSRKRKHLLRKVSGISAEALEVMRHSRANNDDNDRGEQRQRRSKTVTMYPR